MKLLDQAHYHAGNVLEWKVFTVSRPVDMQNRDYILPPVKVLLLVHSVVCLHSFFAPLTCRTSCKMYLGSLYRRKFLLFLSRFELNSADFQ